MLHHLTRSGLSVVALLFGLAAPLCGQDTSALPVGLSAHGLPGLVNVPVAAGLEPGYVDLSFNTASNFDLWGGQAEWQYNVHFAFGLFDRVVLSARGAEVHGVEPREPYAARSGPDFTITVPRNHLHRDLSGSLHVLVLKERGRQPALALGATDVGGANALFEGRYGVLSKTFFDQLRLTAGFGMGPDFLDGPLAGVEWAPSEHLTLLGEYDGRELNGGVRVVPVPSGWLARGLPRPTVDVYWSEVEGVSWGVAVRTPFDRDVAEDAGGGGRLAGPGEAGEGTRDDVDGLAERLVLQGFENVRVSPGSDGRLLIEYENRRFNQHELDGLSRVLSAVARSPERGGRAARVAVLNAGVAAAEVEVAGADLDALAEGRMAPSELADRVEVAFPGGGSGGGPADSPTRNPSRLKLDVFLEPELETFVFTEVGVWDGRISLTPRGVLQLLPGTVVEAGYRFPLDQTSDYWILNGELPDPHLDRALFHHARRVSELDARSDLWVQWSGGRFDPDRVGLRQETALFVQDGVFSVGTDVAWVGESFEELDQVVATAGARYLLPRWGTRLSLTAGRFLFEDWGAVGELSRFYGDTEVGLLLRHTERGSQAGIRIALPLTFERDLKPSRIRPRLPDRWQYTQQTTVFQDRNIVRSDIARTLPMDHSLENAYFDRDRLLPVVVKQDLARPRFWRR